MFKKIKDFFSSKKDVSTTCLSIKVKILEERMQQIEEINANLLQEVLSVLKSNQGKKLDLAMQSEKKSSQYH